MCRLGRRRQGSALAGAVMDSTPGMTVTVTLQPGSVPDVQVLPSVAEVTFSNRMPSPV